MTHRPLRVLGLVVSVAMIATGLAACGSDSATTETGTETAATTTAAGGAATSDPSTPAGTSEETSSAPAATGDPIIIGSVLTITNPIWDNSGTQAVNLAFASYINEELGGINGRPLQIESCDDHGDPAKTTQCYNNLVDAGAVAFVNNSSLAFGANALPAMEKAGFASVGGWPVSPGEFASPNGFLTTPGSSGSYPSIAVYFRAKGAKNLAMLFANSPAGQTAADNIEKLWSAIGGETFTGVEYDPTAADFTPNAAKVAAANPDAVIFATGDGTAPRLFQALDLTGIDVMRGATSTAATKQVLETSGPAIEGMAFSFAAVPPDFAGEDADTYRAIMAEHSPDTELTNQTGAAASSMMYLYDGLAAMSGDITKESILAQFQGMSTWPGFLTHSVDRSRAPEATPAVGNPYNMIAVYGGGKFTPEVVDNPGDLAPYLSDENGLTWIAGSPRD